MHNLDFVMFGEKPTCYASNSLPLSETVTFSSFCEVAEDFQLNKEVHIPENAETFEVLIHKNSLGNISLSLRTVRTFLAEYFQALVSA